MTIEAYHIEHRGHDIFVSQHSNKVGLADSDGNSFEVSSSKSFWNATSKFGYTFSVDQETCRRLHCEMIDELLAAKALA